MDIFDLRDRVIDQYSKYVRSFFTIREDETRGWVDDYFSQGKLWPEPLVQLNPSFKRGATVEDLVGEGVLRPECSKIFRRGKTAESLGETMHLHQHQEDAVRVAETGASYVLTTGTGSGKSLAYFIPIVDHVLRNGSGKGIKAIVVYPMNALANSQLGELEKFLGHGYPPGRPPVTFKRYTGQERDDERERIRTNPPDILLTNFVMLELILTRPFEHDLVEAAQSLEFLVLDELHTYRGRQGADVALLVRRLRERCGAPTMRCVGTSATIAGSGTREERQADIARLATRFFGQEVRADHVVMETVQQAIPRPRPTTDDLSSALHKDPSHYPTDFGSFSQDPVAAWAEVAFGLKHDALGRLERCPPQTLTDVAQQLANETGQPLDRCRAHLRSLLLAGYHTKHPDTGLPLFAFRLHQFIGRGGRVFATLEAEGRHLTTEEQIYAPGADGRDRRLFPLAFCRECGAEYAAVMRDDTGQLHPRDLSERATTDSANAGYIYLDPLEQVEFDAYHAVEDWVEYDRHGNARIKRDARVHVPQKVWVTPDGRLLENRDAEGPATAAWWFPALFQYCLACGVTYPVRQGDFAKLAELSTEGRSTATTILSLATVTALRGDESLPDSARKLLSFTDNRQDASLQAGHFNDFVQVAMVRAALLAAVQEKSDGGLRHDEIAQRVTERLALDVAEYASNPQVRFAPRESTDEALRGVIAYLVYNDLRRGWRVNAPNLEQVGLLRIEYASLNDLCTADDVWQGRHELLAGAKPDVREKVCRAVLDYMRRELAIKVRYLDTSEQDRIKQRSEQWLREPWAIDPEGSLNSARPLRLQRAQGRGRSPLLTPNNLLGRYLRRGSTWPGQREWAERLRADELGILAKDLLDALAIGGLVERSGTEEEPAYLLQAAALHWVIGDGTPPEDPVRAPGKGGEDRSVNAFFSDLYEVTARGFNALLAHEHTAQVPVRQRIDREEDFRSGALPILYCSPTMELGVDISDLNAVHLRNAPPTPANYAQRSGRAGRSGQPALVLTYCTNNSPHDLYYFKHQTDLVAGQVQPPRLDLTNEDLLRAHVHAVWLAETKQDLHHSVAELLDLTDLENLPLHESVSDSMQNAVAREAARARAQRLLTELAPELQSTSWYSEHWLDEVINSAFHNFDQAAERWRRLYRAAREQADRQHQIIQDPTRSAAEKREAERLRSEAETQVRLLISTDAEQQGDFYSYRYFASEGFLPGYNFPRLPLSAYLPGRTIGGDRSQYLQRGRFLAVSEFGPRSIIYHEGSRYRVMRALFASQDADRHLVKGKVCAQCGYGHLGMYASADVCSACGTVLAGIGQRHFEQLMRLTNVSTRRIDRITSDEEERLRLGYEIVASYRFDDSDGTLRRRLVEFVAPSTGDGAEMVLARGAYAPAATLWRINLGWAARKQKELVGFPIDLDTGHWGRSENEHSAEQSADDIAPRARRETVVPYVEDRRNVLVFSLAEPYDPGTLASVQYALKRGIEAVFQIEDSELAVEALPDRETRGHTLFYEAAEGGAGVLTRLAEEPNALATVARRALEICHFDPDSGEEVPLSGRDPCVAACYDCLLSYYNQRDHELLDRQKAKPLLLQLAHAMARIGAGGATRSEQYVRLQARCDTQLELRFLRFLYEEGYRLPDEAQKAVNDARPDFFYGAELQACVYVDGPLHEFPDRAQRDAVVRGWLDNAGFCVIRVADADTWEEAMAEYPWVFGSGRNGG